MAIAAVDDAYAGVGQVGNLYTAPDHRREGIARHLLDVLQHDVRRLHDIERLVLFVEEDNDGARALYRAMDFTPAGAFGMIFSDTAPSLGFVQVPSRA